MTEPPKACLKKSPMHLWLTIKILPIVGVITNNHISVGDNTN
jgi:hypothetical protein